MENTSYPADMLDTHTYTDAQTQMLNLWAQAHRQTDRATHIYIYERIGADFHTRIQCCSTCACVCIVELVTTFWEMGDQSTTAVSD